MGPRKHQGVSGVLTRGLARLWELAGPRKLRNAQQDSGLAETMAVVASM